MRFLSTFLFILGIIMPLNAQKLRFVGGVGGGVFGTNSTFSEVNERFAVSFTGGTDDLFPTLEAYIEKPFTPYFSVRTGINAWQFRAKNFIQNSALSSQPQFLFQAVTTEFKNWGIPLNFNFKIKNWQIISGLGYNFVVSSLKPTESIVFRDNPEAQAFMDSFKESFKKSFLSSYWGFNYQYEKMVFELKFTRTSGSLIKNNFAGKVKANGIYLSVFFQFDLDEN